MEIVLWILLLTGFISCQEDIFQHGVASGDPLSDKVIIWTRVTVDTPAQGVQWEVATDTEFNNIVTGGQTITGTFFDYTVKVDVEGLEPNTEYFYRFSTMESFSPVGKTKTLPVGEVEEIKLAVVSNANWRQGFFNVYEAVSNVQNLDLVLIPGDYIMPYSSEEYPDVNLDYPDLSAPSAREGLLPEDDTESLEEFRQRYALYRTDKSLQKMHQNVAVIAMWDDKEFDANGAYKDNENHVDVFFTWEEKKQNAIQAYLEWMPVRLSLNQTEYYRSFTIGNLAVLNIPETRISVRTEPVEVEPYLETINAALPIDFNLWNEQVFLTAADGLYSAMDSPDNQILGEQQLEWLKQKIQEAESGGVVWNLMMMGSPLGTTHFPDIINSLEITGSENDKLLLGAFLQLLVQEETTRYAVASGYFKLPTDPETWDGYSYERQQLFEIISSAEIPSVIFSGDTNAVARDLPYGGGSSSAAVEFTTPSVCERSFFAYFGDTIGNSLTVDWSAWFDNGLVLSNPGIKFVDVKNFGFIIAKISQEQIQSNFYSVSTAMEQDFGVLCQGTFTVLRDDPKNLVVGNCSQVADEFVAGTTQILTSEIQGESPVTAQEEMMGTVMQAVLPFFLNSTTSGDEIDVNQILQTPELQNLMVDQLMSNFTQLTNITLDSEDDENAAEGFVQMIISSVTDERIAEDQGNATDTDFDINIDVSIGG